MIKNERRKIKLKCENWMTVKTYEGEIVGKCMVCKKELRKREIKLYWNFGKIWFCGNSCATAWCVEQIIRLKKCL